MFPQQRKIYENIKNRITSNSTVLEVGCGIGLGTALLDRSLTTRVIGTDNLLENVKIARALYPWIRFERIDICTKIPLIEYCKPVDTVIAVEVLEHVEDAKLALINMCSIAFKEVWISTPNGYGKPRPPSNSYHVQEYTSFEVVLMIPRGWEVRILEYENFNVVGGEELIEANPLVYHLTKVTK